MTSIKILLITSAITLPLGFFVSTWIPKANNPTEDYTAPSIATRDDVLARENNTLAEQNKDVTELKKEVADLKAQMATLRSEIRGSIQSNTSKGSTELDANTPLPSNTNEQALRAQEEKYFAEQGEALQSDFTQQTVDFQWSAEVVPLIKNALAKDKINEDAISNLVCRNRTCRLELTHDDKNRLPELVEFSQQIAGELSNIMVSRTESSDSATVFYLSKEQFVLPNNTNQ